MTIKKGPSFYRNMRDMRSADRTGGRGKMKDGCFFSKSEVKGGARFNAVRTQQTWGSWTGEEKMRKIKGQRVIWTLAIKKGSHRGRPERKASTPYVF